MTVRQYSPSLQELPIDVAIKIAGDLAATSDRPMDDLHSLRATCRFMRKACRACALGKRMALARFQMDMSWNEPAKYRSLLAQLTAIGNPHVCFITGIWEYFGQHGGPQPSLIELSRAAQGGHKVAPCLFTLVLYRNNGGARDDDIAKMYIRRVECEEGSAATGGVEP